MSEHDEGEHWRAMQAMQAALAAQEARIAALERATEQRESAGSGTLHTASPTDADGVLGAIVELGAIVGTQIGQAPYRALLDGIVQAARRILNAGAASIALLDHTTDELVFEAAAGGSDVVNKRFPSHQGIAGWVVMTGEPIAVADVRRDPRFASDFAASTGYVPTSILAVPLLVGEDVEGVLEVLDKPDAGTFGLDDMDTLALFARPAAIAVEQARLVSATGLVLVRELERLAGLQGQAEVAAAAQRVLAVGAANQAGERMLDLALLVRGMSRHGERGRILATEVLGAVARFAG